MMLWYGGALRCVVCVAAEPPPSSDNSVGDVGAAGAAALAGALEKNTSLQTLDLYGEISFFFY